MQDILQFHNFCRSGNIAAAKAQLRESPVLINSRDPYGETPLTAAAVRGNSEIVEFLLDAGADIDAVTDLESSALIKACVGGQYTCCEVLLHAHLLKDGFETSEFCSRLFKCLELSVRSGNFDIFKLLDSVGFCKLHKKEYFLLFR